MNYSHHTNNGSHLRTQVMPVGD